MNEFNVLLAAATNGTPSGSLFDALFARYIAPQESWRKLESPLPITILAAGKDLIDYRIYGASGGVGEQTENLWNFDESAQGDGYVANQLMVDTGTVGTNAFFISEYIPVTSGQSYIYFTDLFRSSQGVIKFYNITNGEVIYLDKTPQKSVLSRVSYSTSECASFTVPTNTSLAVTHIRINVDKKSAMFFIIKSSTAPASYIPFGYKLPMVVTNGTTTTTTPIYIGSDPLAEDEYVDFGEQKIYRVEGGTLTPADPPVPIPALPTIEGKTIIDYNPSETPAVEPEKMYIKYKPR